MSIAIVYNKNKRNAEVMYREVVRVFTLRGIAFTLLADDSALPEDAVCLVVVGGDGTLLHYAPMAYQRGIPIWAINAGNVGFLSDHFAVEAIPSAVSKLQYALGICAERVPFGRISEVQSRLLEITTNGGIYYAINDVVVTRSQMQAATMRASINGDPVLEFRGDGIILATPLGSTSYSLSAGGSVLAPGIEGTILTPVCAHGLSMRPLVIPGSDEVSLSAEVPAGGSISVDGALVESGTHLRLTARLSQKTITLLRLDGEGFYERLNHLQTGN